MKINDYNATLDEKMSEFDMWVTPSLGEIRDTPQFRVNLEQLKKGFDYMADITENFADDFIVPFQSRRLGAKVFIQSQFYAGDSGSVYG